MSRWPRRLFLPALGVMLAACAGPARPAAGGRAASSTQGDIVFADGDRLLLANPGAAGAMRELHHSRGKGTIADPAWSPDRARIAYAYTPVPAPAASFGSDIVTMNADGSGQRTLFTHHVDGGLARAPVWAADGSALYFAYSYSVKPAGQTQFTTVQQVDRLDVTTGARQTVAPDADMPAVSPDGARLAYIKLPSEVVLGQPAKPGAQAPAPSLWIANGDGSQPRAVVDDGRFQIIWSSRFAPDGRSLVFTAAGGDRTRPRLSVQFPRAKGTAWAPAVAAHGFPLDLWLVEIDSGKLELLAALAADDLVVAWSPDGTRLALQSADGLFVLELATGVVTLLASVAGFGTLDWSR